ncbi:MAG: hypothetical protein IRZ16_14905 [Myxococcaceae bacterium]|nr:hypothetical protein [Myxococcaceae bacterium]
MSPLRSVLLVIATVTLAASCRDWPDPVIRSITPSQMVASEATPIELRAEVPLQTTVDYAEGSASVDTAVSIRIGGVEVGHGQYAKGGVFQLVVPTVFQPGPQDVTLELADGRSTTLAGGFTVSEGQWPDGYTIDVIPPQRQLEPFTVTVRAAGEHAASFHGNVRFEVPPGATVGPQLSEPFVDGVLTQTITIRSPRNEELLIVSDVAGHRASSNTFDLR